MAQAVLLKSQDPGLATSQVDWGIIVSLHHRIPTIPHPHPRLFQFLSCYGFFGGAYRMPFAPARNLLGSGILKTNSLLQLVKDETRTASYFRILPLNPDVAILSVQHCNELGNCHY